MSWSKEDYPDSMKNLEKYTRDKAIEIANALLRDDYDESRAIAIAISQAKNWASRRSIIKTDGNNQHVVPHEGRWAILREGNERVSHVYDTKKLALEKAKEMARREKVKVIIHREDGTIQENIIP